MSFQWLTEIEFVQLGLWVSNEIVKLDKAKQRAVAIKYFIEVAKVHDEFAFR